MPPKRKRKRRLHTWLRALRAPRCWRISSCVVVKMDWADGGSSGWQVALPILGSVILGKSSLWLQFPHLGHWEEICPCEIMYWRAPVTVVCHGCCPDLMPKLLPWSFLVMKTFWYEQKWINWSAKFQWCHCQTTYFPTERRLPEHPKMSHPKMGLWGHLNQVV
jgi:hypothetical protein